MTESETITDCPECDREVARVESFDDGLTVYVHGTETRQTEGLPFRVVSDHCIVSDGE